MIQTHNLERVFKSRFRQKSVSAVRNLNLSIVQGELFGLVGPDGAGKTTTLRMLAGILKPTGGQATVNGFDVDKEAEAIKQTLGYMPQQFGLYGDLTVDENMHFVCDVFNVVGPERGQRIREQIEFTGLGDFRDRRGGALSGGMQKKLSLAAALIHHPKLLLLDEPTTGVDPVARREFWDILSTLHAEGATVVVSTPYMDEAERCNRMGLMYNGELMMCDTPAAIKRRLPGIVLGLRADDLIRAETLLKSLPCVIDVQPYGDTLNILTRSEDGNVETVQTKIEHALLQGGIVTDNLHPVPPRLEEAFIYFVRQYGATNKEATQ